MLFLLLIRFLLGPTYITGLFGASHLKDLPTTRFNPLCGLEEGAHTKTGLACARPAYYEVQPAMQVTYRLSDSPNNRLTDDSGFALAYYSSWIEVAGVPFWIFFTKPCSTLPGPTSTNCSAPSASMCCTD